MLILIPYILPLITILLWRMQPTRALALAAALLFIGLLIYSYFDSLAFIREFKLDRDEFAPWDFETGVLWWTFRPFLIGVGILLTVRLISQYFHKKLATKRRVKSTFD